MNKKNEQDIGEKMASNIRSYFSKEVNDRIQNMSKSEMDSLLKELIDSEIWIAMLKYSSMRYPQLDATLRTANPVTNAYEIAWTQGCYAGLCDMQTYIIDSNYSKNSDEEESVGNDNGVIVG